MDILPGIVSGKPELLFPHADAHDAAGGRQAISIDGGADGGVAIAEHIAEGSTVVVARRALPPEVDDGGAGIGE